METIATILGFVLISVLVDAFESRKKKKRQDAPLPQPDMRPERAQKRAQRPRRPAPEPAATPQPRQTPRVQTAPPACTAALSTSATAFAPGATEREAERHFPDPSQLYSNALLDAVAYAEILQPPKAYQYMATRSCTGRWPENRR